MFDRDGKSLIQGDPRFSIEKEPLKKKKQKTRIKKDKEEEEEEEGSFHVFVTSNSKFMFLLEHSDIFTPSPLMLLPPMFSYIEYLNFILIEY